MTKTVKTKKKTNLTLKTLLYYLHGYWKDTIFTWLFTGLECVAEVLVAFFMQYLINNINDSNLNGIYKYSIIIASLAIGAAIFGILAGYWASSASSGFAKNLRKTMFAHIQDYSFSNIDKFSSSSIVTRTTTDVTNVQNAFQQIIRAVIRAPLMMIFALIMCFITQWKLSWIFLIIIPFILVALLFIASKAHPIFVDIFNKYDGLNEEVQEDVDGIRVVKSFDRENYQDKKFSKVSVYIHDHFIKAEKLLAFNNPIMDLAIYGACFAIAYFGALMIIKSNGSQLTVGGLTTLVTYVMMIMMSLMMITMVYVSIIIARNSAERIVEIIVEKPSIVSPKNATKEIKDGSVDFNNVSLAYNSDKYVLSDINLHIKSGSSVGIIGSTGAGKTSLVSLIARLYDATKGEVLVASKNVKEYDLKALRDSVAVVLQKNTLFTGTIRDNLKWGNSDATDEQINQALDLAQANEFIQTMPEGLDTMLDEGGTNVSGGQKQRLCIARALLKNPKILILDDSTSACDTHTDALIRQGLSSTRKDITKIIIAQRVLSICDCDDIVVMNEGKIVAEGNNAALMETCPVYKELYQSQLGGGDFDAN